MTQYALLSVTDKIGIEDFARQLTEIGFKILSTGGTAELLEKAGLEVIKVSDYTGFPEILDGRVKTLHPRIHAGILADSQNQDHIKQLEHLKINKIEVVCINLYDFTGEAVSKNLSFENAIEYIDVGGPSMLRGAAKNFKNTYAVTDTNDYAAVISDLKSPAQTDLRKILAIKAFQKSAAYEQDIANYLQSKGPEQAQSKNLELILAQKLRYGENPLQKANFYFLKAKSGLSSAKILQGKALSYNNILDLSAAAELAVDLLFLAKPTTVIIKHTNPCGVAVSDSLLLSFEKAWQCDPKSAFGGIICCTEKITEELAEKISELFVECVVAPEFSDSALSIFGRKKNLRLLQIELKKSPATFKYRSVWGGVLEQSLDDQESTTSTWENVTEKKLLAKDLEELQFAEIVCKHTLSNAIVLTKNFATIGIGGGQVSRIDALELSLKKAQSFGFEIKNCYLASDAFFPFSDCVEIAAKHGVQSIVQPGGSVKDQESIAAANKFQIGMAFSGQRHFKH